MNTDAVDRLEALTERLRRGESLAFPLELRALAVKAVAKRDAGEVDIAALAEHLAQQAAACTD